MRNAIRLIAVPILAIVFINMKNPDIPLTVIAIGALALLIMLWMLQVHRNGGRLKPLGPGHCRTCGYCVKYLSSTRCPECGARIGPS